MNAKCNTEKKKKTMTATTMIQIGDEDVEDRMEKKWNVEISFGVFAFYISFILFSF